MLKQAANREGWKYEMLTTGILGLTLNWNQMSEDVEISTLYNEK